MPELPEVETTCRALAPILEGSRFTEVVLMRPDLRFKFPVGFCDVLQNKTITSVKRRAKYILVTLEDGTVLISHLGMSGSFRLRSEESSKLFKHEHVVFFTSSGHELRYCDPRRFGFMLIAKIENLENHFLLKNLGLEPLSQQLSASVLRERLQKFKAPIKNVLLNQKVIAGIGNIYACEALNLSKISPNRKACNVGKKRSKDLVYSIIKVLSSAIKAGGSSLQDFQSPVGEMGYFQKQFRVYNQEGNYCPNCGTGFPIQRIIQAGRATFFCSNCQR